MHTITRQFNAQFAPLRLPKVAPARKRESPRDLRAAEGVIIGVLAGGNALLWGYILARAVFG